jgi:choline dehydrogenase-like flavoprotein
MSRWAWPARPVRSSLLVGCCTRTRTRIVGPSDIRAAYRGRYAVSELSRRGFVKSPQQRCRYSWCWVASATPRAPTEANSDSLFGDMVRAVGGELLNVMPSNFQDHPCGGRRMGSDESNGVCDAYRRTFQHDNLFVIGAPTCVTASCADGTLTFVAVSIMQATDIERTVD